MTFLYEYVCGNHRVWGAQGIAEAKIIHIGNDQSTKAFDMMRVEVKKYAEASAKDDELKVQQCRRYVLGANKDDVLGFRMDEFRAMLKSLDRKIDELAAGIGSPRTG